MSIWYLLLFVVIATGILYIVNWMKNGTPDTGIHLLPYVSALLFGGVLAYFIKQPVAQAILLILTVFSVGFIIKGITIWASK